MSDHLSQAIIGLNDDAEETDHIFEYESLNEEVNEATSQEINEIDDECSILGKVFPTLDAVYEWYNKYALKKGFGTRINWNTRSKKTNEIIRKRYVCNKEGYKDVKDVGVGKEVKRYRDTRTGCEAMLEVKLTDSKEWVICKFNDNHNHMLTTPSKVFKHRSYSNFHKTTTCRQLVGELSTSGIKPAVISRALNVLTGGHEVNVTARQCSKYIQQQRRSHIGQECVGIIKHFLDKSTTDDDHFFAIDLSDDASLRSIFWADGRSRCAYSKFGDVLVFDVTYKTNKFKMPFAPFVGVNHHRQSILFGGALLADETEGTFVWLFDQFLKCMHNVAPVAIITDQDIAMGNAIKKVFPAARHRYCSWHINKHAMEHLAGLRAQHTDFSVKYNELIKSDTIDDFESRWASLREQFRIEHNHWLTRMYNLRKHWVKAYLKDQFFAGMTSSERSESIHAFFDGYLNSNTMLNEFVVQYDLAVNARREAENHEDFRTLNTKAVLCSEYPIEAQAGKCYTRAIFDRFQIQWKKNDDLIGEKVNKIGNLTTYKVGHVAADRRKWRMVTFESFGGTIRSNCSCAMFETEGLLCKHILSIFRKKYILEIPSCYILDRWTIDIRYQTSSHACPAMGGNASKFNAWSRRIRFSKALEDADSHPHLIQRLDDVVEGVSIVT